ncbi:hypothetical protein [Pedobacter caeni]|uniref:Uncharacterized protein n=1 Tax=Pedobacter caeni TaxID=288992 RepID=A0A1M5GCA2_9SPHI|nr:hypothetical protein [Pedobacter caeni]SHG01344.1 hypothetical protein SAMN04488522_104155 [Pedobacter caeni]
MKKNILFSALLLGALVSCKKKDFLEKPPIDPTVKLEYSKLSVEEHKKTLETSGVNFLGKINTLPNEKFIAVISRLAELDLELLSNSVVGKQLLSSSLAAKGKNVDAIFSAVTSTNTGVKSGSLNEFYGIYTWDPKTSQFTKTASKDKLEISYPATEASKTNNAILTASYTASKATATVDGTAYELPATVKATLTVDQKKELELNSQYEFNADGTPLKSNIELTLGSFALNVKLSNDLKAINSTVAFLKGTETLFAIVASGNGNGNLNAIKEATRFDEVLQNANAGIRIMNLQLAGQIDVKAISAATKAAEKLPEAEKSKKKAEAYANNTILMAFYTTDNTIIAKSDFVSVEDTYSYWGWDPITNKSVEKKVTYYEVEPRLVFQDGSKLSLKAFFKVGFSKLIGDFEAYANRF